MKINLPTAIIVDLDDCLFDSRPLNKYLPKDIKSREEWDLFQSKVCECCINDHIKELVLRLAERNTIIFITSREARKNSIRDTKAMLDYELKNYSISQGGDCASYATINYQLFMRAEEDYRPSDVVKKDLYNSCVKDRYNVLFAIDDDSKNISMFKSLGINTLRCEYGKGR